MIEEMTHSAMGDIRYNDAVKAIKAAILQSQYDAAKSVNEKQLMLYYWVGHYIACNSRKGTWGKGAIDTISERLQAELPGLRGFSARNLRNMRMFYEAWSLSGNDEDAKLADMSAILSSRGKQAYPLRSIPLSSFCIGKSARQFAKTCLIIPKPNMEKALWMKFPDNCPWNTGRDSTERLYSG